MALVYAAPPVALRATNELFWKQAGSWKLLGLMQKDTLDNTWICAALQLRGNHFGWGLHVALLCALLSVRDRLPPA